MKKKNPVLIAFAFGALPFLVGGIQNWYILAHADSAFPYGLISLAALLVWECIAFFLDKHYRMTRAIFISLNLIAPFDLLLLAFRNWLFMPIGRMALEYGHSFSTCPY